MFLGEIASTMDKLTTRALQAQVEAAVRISIKVLCWHTDFLIYTEC